MNEKMGFVQVMFIAAIFGIPLFFSLFTLQVESTKLLNVSTGVQQLVAAQGGVTNEVKHVIEDLDEKGFVVEIKDKNGEWVDGLVPTGTVVYIDYEYRGKKTSNFVTILKRDNLHHRSFDEDDDNSVGEDSDREEFEENEYEHDSESDSDDKGSNNSGKNNQTVDDEEEIVNDDEFTNDDEIEEEEDEVEDEKNEDDENDNE